MGSLFILSRQCSYPVILRKILTELQVYHSSFSFSSLEVSIQALSIISLCSFKCYPMPVPLIIVHLSLFLFGVLKISWKIRVSILNQFKLFGDCYLIQAFNSTGAISISINRSIVFSFEWALTHMSFSRILPDSSNVPGASQILFQVWRKNEL